MSEEPSTYRSGVPQKEPPPPRRFSLLRPLGFIPRALWWWLDEHLERSYGDDYGRPYTVHAPHTFLLWISAALGWLLSLGATISWLAGSPVTRAILIWIACLHGPIFVRYCIRKMFLLDVEDTRVYWRRKLLGEEP